MRQGIGFKYFKLRVRLTAEFMQGAGVIFTGLAPPFAASDPIGAFRLGSDNRSSGWYIDGGWRIVPKWEIDVRVDRFNQLSNTPSAERNFSTWTLGLQHHLSPRARITLNYEVRDLWVPHPDAIEDRERRQDAEAIAAAMGNRLDIQATVIF